MRTASHKKVFYLAAAICLMVIFIIVLITILYQQEPHLPVQNDKPLVVVWELADVDFAPSAIDTRLPVDVVSPTWFKVVDNDGTISSQVDKDYLEWARDQGYQIWALVSNSFDPDITAAVLSDPLVRQNVVDDLIDLILLYQLEGINIDFENFHADYSDHFSQFIRELGLRCKAEDIILSVDVTMISTSDYWGRCYDRPALAAEVDYIILMAYDEHWTSSPSAGSVASLPWVENGLNLILKEVPPEKLILGVPFYTRLWGIENYDSANPVVVSSYSYSMHRAAEIISDNDAEIYWDEDAGQYVARYNKNDLTYKMWLEETRSMQSRLELVERYGLAGIAGWRRGLEKPEIWELIDDFFNQNTCN